MFWFSVLVQLLVTFYPHTAMGTKVFVGGLFLAVGLFGLGLCVG